MGLPPHNDHAVQPRDGEVSALHISVFFGDRAGGTSSDVVDGGGFTSAQLEGAFLALRRVFVLTHIGEVELLACGHPIGVLQGLGYGQRASIFGVHVGEQHSRGLRTLVKLLLGIVHDQRVTVLLCRIYVFLDGAFRACGNVLDRGFTIALDLNLTGLNIFAVYAFVKEREFLGPWVRQPFNLLFHGKATGCSRVLVSHRHRGCGVFSDHCRTTHLHIQHGIIDGPACRRLVFRHRTRCTHRNIRGFHGVIAIDLQLSLGNLGTIFGADIVEGVFMVRIQINDSGVSSNNLGY